MPFHVFLSHSSVDKPAVEELARRLEATVPTMSWRLTPGRKLAKKIFPKLDDF
jgi:hypothetical protein